MAKNVSIDAGVEICQALGIDVDSPASLITKLELSFAGGEVPVVVVTMVVTASGAAGIATVLRRYQLLPKEEKP